VNLKELREIEEIERLKERVRERKKIDREREGGGGDKSF